MMHYYSFNIADYKKDTAHLKPMEHYIYRSLIDLYYLNETPIPLKTHSVMRWLSLETHDQEKMLLDVLNDFFEEHEDGFYHKRIEDEVEKYHTNAEKNRVNGKKGGRPPKNKPKETQLVSSGNQLESELNPNQEPITNNQEPLTINNTESEVSKNTSDDLVQFWNENRPSNAQVKVSIWSKKVKTRLKTFTADEIKQAMIFVINDSWYQSNSQVLIKNVIDSDDRCAAVLEKSSQPAKTNYQGNNNAIHQSANSQPKQQLNHFDQLRAEAAAKYGTSDQSRDIRTVSETFRNDDEYV